MTELGVNTTGLSAAEVAALERHREWLTAHPERASSVSLLSADAQAEMDWWVQEQCPDALLLWHDDASNYAGVYVAGPLRGMVFLLAHDEEDVAPRFASIDSFVDVLVTDTSDVRDFGMLSHSEPGVTDYPPEQLDARLLGIARRVFAAAEWSGSDADDDAQFQAFRTALALVPAAHVPQPLIDDICEALLRSDNLYLWQEAPELLSAHPSALGAQVADAVAAHRGSARWTDVIEPVRAVIRAHAGS